MLPRSRTSWAYIPCVTATGTSRPPAPPVATASMRVLIGWPINSRTRNRKKTGKKQPAATHPFLFVLGNVGGELEARVLIDRRKQDSGFGVYF